MKDRWRTHKLGEVCPVDKRIDCNPSLPYVGLEQIEAHTGKLTASAGPSTAESSTFAFTPHHVLYGRLRPYLNKVLTPNFSGRCSSEIIPLKPLPSIDRKFVFYWLLQTSIVERINNTSTGTRMPRANMNAVMQFDFSYPSLAEQKRIVAILDETFEGIDKAIANTKKNLANARELFEQTVADRIFGSHDRDGWTVTTVRDVAAPHKGSIRTGPFGSQLLHSEFVDAGIAVLGIDNAVENEFTWHRRRYITHEKYASLSRYTVRPGDVIITIMGTCGRCAVIPDDVPTAINTKHLCCITLDPTKCLPHYMHAYFLLHPLAKAYLQKHAKGAIMAGLNMGLIQELPLALPSIEHQREISEAIDSLRNQSKSLEKYYHHRLALLRELRLTILKQAFSGQLAEAAEQAAESAAVQLPTQSPEFSAKILAFAHSQHAAQLKEKTFGRVKAQKVLHLVESTGGIDLGRAPIKDAAGPNDSAHQYRAEDWAKEAKLFEFKKRGQGYELCKLAAYSGTLKSIVDELGPYRDRLDKVLKIVVPMNSQEAEVLATVHAAWNNLLLDGIAPSDDAIVTEARENWHAAKLKIPKSKFFNAIKTIRQHKLEPDGTAKRVGGQGSFF